MAKWRWYEYDVWGNKKDGYEVNQVFRTAQIFDLSEESLNSDKKIIDYLRKEEFIKKGVLGKQIKLGGDPYEDLITLEYKGKPVGEFRRE
jgi:hypothetical protein